MAQGGGATRWFCTYLDANYLVRFLPMYWSLRRHTGGALRLFVLCFDEGALRALRSLGLPEVTPIALGDFEGGDAALRAAKRNRAPIEYYFTCTPSLVRYVFREWPEVDRLTYVDADLFFFSSPEPLFREMGEAPILIIPHRFSDRWKAYAERGCYNVAFLTFRRDEEALRCLDWWRERCLEWCGDRVEAGRFADQKYLDEWPARFRGVHVLQHRGADVGPWNIEQTRIGGRGGCLTADGVPLVFYHFEGFCREAARLMDPGLSRAGYRVPARIVRRIHVPYVNAVLRARRVLRRQAAWDASRGGDTRALQGAALPSVSFLHGLRCGLEGRYVWLFAGRAWYWDGPIWRALFRWYDALRRGAQPCLAESAGKPAARGGSC